MMSIYEFPLGADTTNETGPCVAAVDGAATTEVVGVALGVAVTDGDVLAEIVGAATGDEL